MLTCKEWVNFFSFYPDIGLIGKNRFPLLDYYSHYYEPLIVYLL